MSTNTSYDEIFLKQIYDSQVKLESALESMLQIIFNLYDDDGDGILTYEDYISFISDLLLISTFMNRMKTEEYNYENVLRVARWSSSNFTSNLFREPQKNITYEVFLQGIMHAVTEHKDMPILGRKLFFTSLMPEVMNFFHFYDKLAKRRGWPTVEINETHNIFEENGEQSQIPENHEQPTQVEPPIQVEQPLVENVIEESPQPNITEEQIAQQVETQEQQIREYQERRQQQFRQQQELRQREQQRVQMELLQQRQQQFQQQFRQNIESRQQEQINAGEELRRLHEEHQQQQLVDRRTYDQFGDDDEPDMPREYKLEDAGIIEISKDEEGFDPIEGDVNVIDFINQNTKDNIAFKFGGRFYLVDKSRLHAMSSLNLKDNSVFYGCMCEIESDWTNPQTWALLNHVVILDPIYFNLQHLGLPIRYVNLNNIRGIIHPNAEHSYYVIEKPEDYLVIPSFASDNILKHGIGSMSGIHCQSGQEDTIYVIKKFTPKIV
jgi:hypothetical protein